MSPTSYHLLNPVIHIRDSYGKYFISITNSLKTSNDFSWRGSLPHHNEIAVDEPLNSLKVPGKYKLYNDILTHQEQFNLRKDAAIRHIMTFNNDWKK